MLAAGALYAYSGPGLAWIGGTARRSGRPSSSFAGRAARRRGRAGGAARRGARGLGRRCVLLAAPELDRIIDFGGSVGTVSERAEADGDGRDLPARRPDGERARRPAEPPEFDNDLGNLFGQISPLEAFGIWPSGDFRVAPGDGAAPGARLLPRGAARRDRAGDRDRRLGSPRRDRAPRRARRRGGDLAAARVGSTPYTAAKALAMVAPLAMLVAARGAPRPGLARAARGAATSGPGSRSRRRSSAAAAISSGLALASAPVGPAEYSAGVGNLANRFGGRATLLVYAGQPRADEFYGWELREAAPACVLQASATDDSEVTPEGFRFVLTTNGARLAPFGDLEQVLRSDGVTLWEPREPPSPPEEATACP